MAVKLVSDVERFFANIQKTPNGCWEWQRVKDKDGYGLFKVGSYKDNSRRMARVHRWSYEEFVGPIPKGKQLDHLCRNRCCANPQHLEPVTNLVNTQRGWRANKSICKSGHPLTGENLYISPDGKRVCKTCRRARVQEYYRRTGGAAQREYDQRNRAMRVEKNRLYRLKLKERKNLDGPR